MMLLPAVAVLIVAAVPGPRAVQEKDCGPGSDPAVLARRGFDLYERDRYAAARACFDRALALAQSALRPADEAEARRGRGRVLFREGRLDDSARELEQARALFQSVSDRLGAARVDSHLGSVAVQRGDRPRARELYEQARAVVEEVGSPGDRAHVLYNLLVVAANAGERDRLVQAGLPLARASGDRILLGRFLHAAGDLATDAGDYAQAEERYHSARAEFEAAGAREALGRVLTSMSRLQFGHGDPEESLDLARAALGVQKEVGDAPGMAQTLNLLGTVSSRLGRHRAAITYFTRALAAARERGDARVRKLLSVRLADAYLASGAASRARPVIEAALRPPVDPDVEPGAWEVQARVDLALRRDESALRAAERAVELARAGRKPLFAPLQTRAQARLRLGRWDEALADAREAVAVVEEVRGRLIPSDYLKQGFGERYQALFGLAIELLARMGRDAEALETAEQARARAFLDLLAARETSPPAPAAAAVPGGARPLDSPAHAAPMQAAAIAATAARLGSHVLGYWVNPDATFVWVVPPGGEPRAVRVAVPASRLAALVGATVAAPDVWRQGGAPETAAWRELHRLLIEPVAEWLPRTPGALLTVVPHGPLFRLSFAALRDRRGQYLIERHALHYVPAVAALGFTDRSAAAARAERYLLVADPAATPTVQGAALPRLPAARREVDAIARLLAGQDVTVLAGERAGEGAVRDALPGRTVIHLATHGVVRDDAPLQSFVALGGGGAAAPGDGRLTVPEIYSLPLDASLVFLSACRSGRGKVTGDGILGLTRGFLSAGAASLVATLWDVPDAPTAALVPAFYRTLRESGERGRALRAAQLDLLRRLRRGRLKVEAPGGAVTLPENPVLWAGFILVGQP